MKLSQRPTDHLGRSIESSRMSRGLTPPGLLIGGFTAPHSSS
jgi:hypothetical protein